MDQKEKLLEHQKKQKTEQVVSGGLFGVFAVFFVITLFAWAGVGATQSTGDATPMEGLGYSIVVFFGSVITGFLGLLALATPHRYVALVMTAIVLAPWLSYLF